MQPVNPDFESAVRASFARQSFMRTLGGRLEHVGPGEVRISWKKSDGLQQQHGFLHAGVATSLVDSACGYAALSLAPADREVLTIEFKMNFLRPASGSEFLAVGRVIKPGRQISVCEGDVWQDGNDRLIARMQATMAIQQA